MSALFHSTIPSPSAPIGSKDSALDIDRATVGAGIGSGGGAGGTGGEGRPGWGFGSGKPRRIAAILDHSLPGFLRGVAGIPLVALVLLAVVLLIEALPAIRLNGFGFFVNQQWNPGNLYGNVVTTHGVAHPPGSSYGAVPLITGTLASSAIALLLAVPVAIGVALLVVEKLPDRLSRSVGFCLEALAGIPSVVFGLWGALTFGPWLARHVAPLLANHVPNVPVLSFFRGPTGAGEGLLTSGVVLAIMVVPIVAATTRDLLRQVPRGTIEGATALGMTDVETLRAVTFPWVRSGVIGACMLGLGRALGETIAVAMVSGSILGANPHNLYSTMTTIAATIVTQLDSALTDASGFAVHTLAEAGLLLLLLTLGANILARFVVRRSGVTVLPVGRGL